MRMNSTLSRRSFEEMSAQRDRSGATWLMQAITGLLLVGILGTHMIAHHFIVEGGLRDYQQVLDYVANPVVFVIEVVFVIVGVIHALLGLQAIITDLRPAPRTMRIVEWGLRIVALVAIAYGIYLAVALQRAAG
jgi:succinate dehydrogenase hydrophobic anchor subunit